MPEPTSTPSPAVESLLASMSLEQKIGQVMIIGFDGFTVSQDLRKLIEDYHIGGMILFARNIQSPEQVARLTNELQTIALQSGHPGLFIAIDQEGGRVARLTESTGFTEFPSAMGLAATGDPQNARRVAAAMAAELKAVGINIDFAPVLDVNNNPANPVIGIRSFSSDPHIVAEYGVAFAQGLQENGILAFGKHFPGHGDTSVDSHIDLPLVPHDRTRLNQIELVPFNAAIAANIAGIMTAHVTFPSIDPTPGLAATLSRPVLTGLLREEMGYNGLIVTDSLEMGALAATGYPPTVGAPLALAAGADLMLFNRDHVMHRQAFGKLVETVQKGQVPLAQLDASVRRILSAKAQYGILNPVQVDALAAAQAVHTSQHQTLVNDLSIRALTLLRDPQNLIPLKTDRPPLVVESEVLRGLTARLGLGGTIFEVGAQPTTDQIANLRHIAADGRTVILAVNDLNLNPAQLTLVQELVKAGAPVIAILYRNPFDAVQLPEAVTVLVTYGFNPPMREALVSALTGKATPSGTLPIEFVTP